MEGTIKRPLFNNKQLAALIIPIIIEQTLAVTVGMADTIICLLYTTDAADEL